MRRLIDIVFSIVAVALTSPLWIVIAIAIKFTSRGPIFFVQQRVGAGARLFGLLKFRSMVASSQSSELTVGDDSRITSVGRIIRRLKLDELPQFINVLAGDMTLVGPRPEVPKFVAEYKPWMLEVLNYKPGLSDPASISFRNEPSMLARADDPEREYMDAILPEKIRMSLDYQAGRTTLTDIGILLRTAFLVFGR